MPRKIISSKPTKRKVRRPHNNTAQQAKASTSRLSHSDKPKHAKTSTSSLPYSGKLKKPAFASHFFEKKRTYSKPDTKNTEQYTSHKKRAAGFSRPQTFAYRIAQTGSTLDLNEPSHPVKKVLSFVGAVFRALMHALISFFRFLFHTVIPRIAKHRVLAVSLIVVCILLVFGLVDRGVTWGRAYDGVSIGEVDVSKMTSDEMREALDHTYSERLTTTSITIFADEEAQNQINDVMTQTEQAAQAEQLSVEEARANNRLWTTNAQDIGASLDVDELIDQALAVGREEGGLKARLFSFIFGTNIPVHVDFDETALERLANDIDNALGDPRIDCSFIVEDGVATATEGHDGFMVNRTTFADKLSSLFLDPEPDDSFIVSLESAPSRTTLEQATAVAAQVTEALANGVRFNYEEDSWLATPSQLGTWVTPCVVQNTEGWSLVATIDSDKAKPAILENIRNNDTITVDFIEDENQTMLVQTHGSGTFPQVAQATVTLQALLFDTENPVTRMVERPYEITIETSEVPEFLSLEEALDLGIVTKIGTYTTEYSSYTGTENRNHNIHLASDILTNGIIDAEGGLWSFNDRAGECNAERGFLPAGTISNDTYLDDTGGGICQVATTIFNAVYEAGLEIITRHNHSLYISSYPVGRDAAVSWPDLDLVWKNETSSDVLMQLSYTPTTLTCTLYSAPTGYSVTSEVGTWQEGRKYSTRTELDTTLYPGTRYVKTTGSDGRSITVVRTVSDIDGKVIRADAFSSVYSPKDEVVVVGPDT